MNFRYPIFLDVTGKKCLVTGQGPELLSKIRGLVAASAEVLYVNPEAETEIAQMAAGHLIGWEAREFRKHDLDGCFLVITDLDNNAPVFRLAEEYNVLCNAVDDPEHCRFSFGAVHRRGDLTVAISTNGWAPAVAVRLRQRFEREIGPEYQTLLSLLKKVRPEITRRIPDFSVRRKLWYQIVDSDALEKIRAGERVAAERQIHEMIDAAANSTSRSDTSDDAAHQ